MKTADVKKLPPQERFLYWIRERHAVYLRRRAGRPKPWTDDDVLRTTFFTNPFREHDKVTVWFRDNVREPLRDDPRVVFATVCFRWFNLPATAEVLMADDESGNLLLNWDRNSALYRLRKVRDADKQVFTGAYMINSPGGEPKLEAIVRRVNNVWEARDRLVAEITGPGDQSMEWAHGCLTQFDGMGGFMAYEVVCDLRYTYVLEDAADKMTWCHIGPGARRGLYRVLGLDFPKGNNAAGCPRLMSDDEEMAEMRRLLDLVNKRLRLVVPPFEMREVEHSLCEVDKWERVLWGDGKAKRRYDGG